MTHDREHEAWLLRRVALLLVLLYLGLAGNRWLRGLPPTSFVELAGVLGYLLCLRQLHRLLTIMPLYGDESVMPLFGLLLGVGLLLKMRLAPEPGALSAWRLAVYPAAMVVLAAAAWVCRNRLHWLDNLAWLAGFVALGVLVLVVSHGTRFRGAMFGPGHTTPTEVIKPLLVVFLAGFLKRRRGLFEVGVFGALWLGVFALLLKQSDLGMVVILGALLLSMFFVATGRTRYLLVGLVIAAVGVVLLYYAAPLPSAAARGQRRVDVWLNPWADPLKSGFQTVQGMFALRAGGVDGAGFGAGLANLTPLVESDFVWVAVAEDLGLLGSWMLLWAYLGLYRRGYRIAALTTEPFRQRLAVGCVTVLAIQTLLNVGGVVRLVPITGITLPFLSHGGSSLLVCAALLGIVLAVGHDVELGEPGPRRSQRALDALADDAGVPDPRERGDGSDPRDEGRPARGRSAAPAHTTIRYRD